MLSTELKAKLIELADKYEKTNFAEDDPSRILSRYKKTADIECAAFISAMLAFGRRDQFLKKIDIIFSQCDACGGPATWLKAGKYKDTFTGSVQRSVCGISPPVYKSTFFVEIVDFAIL